MHKAIFFCTFAILLVEQVSLGAEFYIAPNGDDRNAGTESSPFATLERARDAIRSLSSLPQGGVTVWIRGGDYFRAKSFRLYERDSGTSERPIVYRASRDELVRIIGGLALKPEWFSSVPSTYPIMSTGEPAPTTPTKP